MLHNRFVAKQELVQFIDDLDGSVGDVETVTFGLDGAEYEIDLNAANSSALRDELAAFVAHARRTGGRVKRGTSTVASSSAAMREENAAIREWARANGHDVSERGRIPGQVIEAYRSR